MKADDPFFTMIRDPDQRNKRFVSAVDGTVRNAASYISPRQTSSWRPHAPNGKPC